MKEVKSQIPSQIAYFRKDGLIHIIVGSRDDVEIATGSEYLRMMGYEPHPMTQEESLTLVRGLVKIEEQSP